MAGNTVALVLGSGGARGYAHIGVIEVLAERGFKIGVIAGSSMGALIGGLEAAGRLHVYADWVRGLSKSEVFKLLDPVFSGPGVIRAERILERVSEILEGVRIEDLPIPFTAVATDLLAGREVWFQSGPLNVAIRASIAIPTVITPILVNGRLLVDGGLLNPVPIEPTTATRTDLTIAVSLSGQRRDSRAKTPLSESADARPSGEWLDRMRRGLFDNEMMRPLLERFATEKHDPTVPAFEHATGLSIVDISAMSLDTMAAMIERFRSAAHPPDIQISIPADSCHTLDFHRAEEIIAIGRRCAEQALDDFGQLEWEHDPSVIEGTSTPVLEDGSGAPMRADQPVA
ncbi:MAG: patatin-like phospholipase family protein [Micropruina sp.]